MAHILWTSIIDEVRLIYKEIQATDIKIKRLLKSSKTDVLIVYECFQAKGFIESAKDAIGKIEKVKNKDSEIFKLLTIAAINLNTAIVHTFIVDGAIHQLLCKLYARIFNLFPVGYSFQPEIF
ncbi:hypothetical protein NIES4071_108300 (plasmid) [Calothrix sp. NIES-4071]|nr:hypothetical protein NIES4071_108300 [Calothrix sp. NIES-4071]BAZ64870.1 hypothetical protein NIES4105_106030 [Calothrix sp. NIES-4105]